MSPHLVEFHMSVAIKNAVVAALNAATTYGEKIDALKTLCANVDDVRSTLLPYVASFYIVTLVTSERGGKTVLDKDAAQYETARKALMRLVRDIEGNKPKNATPVAVPKKLLAQGVTMVIEHSMTAGQFNAWVVAVRASVTFAKN
jgi:hypothetical protein